MQQPINRKAQEKGIVPGSKVTGTFRSWGNEIPWTGTVVEVHVAVVTVIYDEPITAEGPYVGEWRTYPGCGKFPDQIELVPDANPDRKQP